jgi:predicted dienelactone hydrolase
VDVDTTVAPTAVSTTDTVVTATTTVPPITTTASTSTRQPVPSEVALEKPGVHGVGRTVIETVDLSRDNRPLRVWVFYPTATNPDSVEIDAEPDATGAPYPVILGDADIGDVMGPHLASHGFVFASVQGQHTWANSFNENMIDYPLDHMATLDALETITAGPIAGLVDTTNAGTIGYSFGGWDALMLTGARIDPDHYAQICASKPASWTDSWWTYVCGQGERWERVVTRAEEVGIATPEGLWEPMGDWRIKAAMPMGAEGYAQTGPEGLASGTAAVLLINASDDDTYATAAGVFEHYSGAELITFVGADHMMIFQPDAVDQMRRFAVAFFKQQLTGSDTYSHFLSQEFVEGQAPTIGESNSYDTLIWGTPGN